MVVEGSNRLKIISELKEIRIKLTKLYMCLGNPNNLNSDMILLKDIVKLENNKDEYEKVVLE